MIARSTRSALTLTCLQILSTPGTVVVAGARNPAKATDLQKLAQKYADRLYITPLDLSDTDTIKVCQPKANTKFAQARDVS